MLSLPLASMTKGHDKHGKTSFGTITLSSFDLKASLEVVSADDWLRVTNFDPFGKLKVCGFLCYYLEFESSVHLG